MVQTGTNKTTAKQSNSSFALSSRNELPLIASNNDYLIDAKSLHQKLKVKTKFQDWFERQIKSYGFKNGEDFFSNLRKSTGGRKATDYHLTLDMAKELCMVERLYATQATLTEISKTTKPMNINGRKMYDYRQVQALLGFSTKSSISNVRRAGYDGLIVVFNGRAYASEEYVRVMMSNAKTRALRAEAKAAKPVLPDNFGQLPLELKGGRHA